jgi:hypothetical protein
VTQYLTSAIPGQAVPGFVPGRPLAGTLANAGATVHPAVLAVATTLPLPTVGSRKQGKSLATVTATYTASATVTSNAFATAGVS